MKTSTIDSYFTTLQCNLERGLFRSLQAMLRKDRKLLPVETERMDYWRILDVACGSGEWTRDAANYCADMEVVGLDIHEDTIKYARSVSKLEHIENTSFCVGDMRKMELFADNSFDIVHGRFLSPVTAPDGWRALLSELVRVCRPGGLLVWTEAAFPLTNSTACARWCDLLRQAIRVDGHTAPIVPLMDDITAMLPCRVLAKSEYCIDISAGTEFCRNLYGELPFLFSAVQPFLVEKEVITAKEITPLTQDMIIDIYADAFRATWTLTTMALEKK